MSAKTNAAVFVLLVTRSARSHAPILSATKSAENLATNALSRATSSASTPNAPRNALSSATESHAK
jgi:hypothetical protein